MKIKENRVELDVKEAIDDYGFPNDLENFGNKVILSQEAMQDFQTTIKNLFTIRSKEISSEEIKEWQDMNEYLNSLDYTEARKRVVFVSEDLYK